MKPKAAIVALVLCLSVAWAAEENEGEGEAKKKKPAVPTFKLDVRKDGQAFVAIRKMGQVAKGELFEVHRGDPTAGETSLAGYARVVELVDGWPKLGFLIGTARHGDELARVAPKIPRLVLLTDQPKGREATELAALCGDRLKVVPIGDKMLMPRPDDLLVAMIHDMSGGVTFLMEDPIVQPHLNAGGTAVVDVLFFTLLRQIRHDEVFHKKPPEFQILQQGDLTRGFDESDRIPWHGKTRSRKVTREVIRKRGRKRYKRQVTVTVREYVTRFLRGIPTGKAPDPDAWGGPAAALGAGKAIASDILVANTAILEDRSAGRLVVFDLVTLNGRAGRDPGCKNKLLFISRLLGTGPQYASYRAEKPDYTSFYGELEALAQANEGTVALKSEGGGSGKDTRIHSLTLGDKDKPLVLIAGCFQGTDWITASALLRLAEVLADNPRDDPKIEWLTQRLRIKIIPILNAHGYEHDTELNGKRCDINRNFPYQWEAYADKARRGKEPLSEPESFIIKRLVEDKKAVAFLEVDADTYDSGYRIVRARDLKDEHKTLIHVFRTILNARLRHRFVVNGDSPLQLRVTRDKGRPSAINWAGALGIPAASVKICGDGEDSLINHDVAIEAALHFLQMIALSLEKPTTPPPPPTKGANAPRPASAKGPEAKNGK